MHLIQWRVEKGERESFDERKPDTPKEYINLTQRCWDSEPLNRPTAKMVGEKLELIYATNSNNSSSPKLFSSSGVKPVQAPPKPTASIATQPIALKNPAKIKGYLFKSITPATKSKNDSKLSTSSKGIYMGNQYK